MYLKWRKEKTYYQKYCTQQGSHSYLMKGSKVLQRGKARRVQQHQTSFTKNVKGDSLSEKAKVMTRNIKKKKKKEKTNW